MAKGRKTGGRRPGSINKTTANVKAALEDAFDKLGGVPSLVQWAEGDPGEFYKLWSKLVPKDVEMSGKNGGPVEITVRFQREGRRTTAS